MHLLELIYQKLNKKYKFNERKKQLLEKYKQLVNEMQKSAKERKIYLDSKVKARFEEQK